MIELTPSRSPLEHDLEQARKAIAVPARVHDHLGHHLGSYSSRQVVWWHIGRPVRPGIRRGRLLSRLPVLPVVLVHKKRARTEDWYPLQRISALWRIWWPHRRWYSEGHGRRCGIIGLALAFYY